MISPEFLYEIFFRYQMLDVVPIDPFFFPSWVPVCLSVLLTYLRCLT